MAYQIHITQSCNLSCKYCSQSHKDIRKSMTKETAGKTVDFIIDHFIKNMTDDNRIISLNITGGEPFLRFDLVTLIVDSIYTKAKTNNLPAPYIEISTNATLLRQEHIDYLSDKNFAFYIGFDGIEGNHNINRHYLKKQEGSYSMAYANIKRYCIDNQRVKEVTTLNMVISPNNVGSFYNSFTFLYKLLDSKNISINIAHEQQWNDDSLKILEREFKKVVQLYTNVVTTDNKNFSLKIIDEQVAHVLRNSEPSAGDCGAATMSFAIGTNGNIYSCGGFSYTGIDEKDITVGNVEDGVQPVLVKKFLDKAFDFRWEECRECAFLNKCFNYCPAMNWLGSKNMGEVGYNLCEINKIIIKTCDDMIEQLYKNHNALFRDKFLHEANTQQLVGGRV